MEEMYDVIIVGGGPAGLSAAVYAARSGASVAVVEQLCMGGLAATTPSIENYLGFAHISGMELAQNMQAHAERSGALFVYDSVEKIEDGERKRIVLQSGRVLYARAVVIATGSVPRRLEIENEQDYLGAGLSYCATCDGNFFRGKTVAVVGGGSYALHSAEYLAPICAKVYRIHSGALPKKEGMENIENARVVALHGMPLSSVTLSVNGAEKSLAVDGLFVCLGHKPATELVRGFVQTDANGYVLCDEKMATSRQGVFAAGDIRVKSLRQIATAVSDGAIAGQFAAVYARKKG